MLRFPPPPPLLPVLCLGLAPRVNRPPSHTCGNLAEAAWFPSKAEASSSCSKPGWFLRAEGTSSCWCHIPWGPSSLVFPPYLYHLPSLLSVSLSCLVRPPIPICLPRLPLGMGNLSPGQSVRAMGKERGPPGAVCPGQVASPSIDSAPSHSDGANICTSSPWAAPSGDKSANCNARKDGRR